MTTHSNRTTENEAIPTSEHTPGTPAVPHQGPATGSSEAALHRMLTGVLRRLDDSTAEALLHAVHGELAARDARAYASGWQDAVTAFESDAGR